MTTTHDLSRTGRASGAASRGMIWGLCVADAALILVSGYIHLHLWRGPYRHLTVGHINDLFLLQVIGCVVVAIAILATRHILTLIAGAGLLAGTFIGFLISRYRTAGLFGWHDPYNTNYSKWALIVEIAGTVLTLLTAVVIRRSSKATS
jgi:hypothetical protein